MPDHVHMLVSIPPKYSIASFMGILALLMSFGSLIVVIIAFLDKRNSGYPRPLEAEPQ